MTKEKKNLLTVRTRPMSGEERFDLPKVKVRKKRVWELDALRGLSILLVCWDHIMMDACSWSFFGGHFSNSGNSFLLSFYDFARDYFSGDLRAFWRPVFLFIFFCVSGICVTFSRNNLLRGIKLALAAGAISLVTYLLDDLLGGAFILFGVVHCFAVIMLFYALVELAVKGITKLSGTQKYFRYIMSAVCLVFAVIGIILDAKFNVSISDFDNHMSSSLTNENLGILFFMSNTFWYTSDYFPIFPFFNFFFIGAAVSVWLYPRKKSLLPFLDGAWHYPLTIPGRISLYLYVFVQVIAVVLLGLISLILTGSIGLF